MARHGGRKHHRQKSHKLQIVIIALIAIMAIAAYIIASDHENRGSKTVPGDLSNRFEDVTLEYNGVTYRYRKDNITTILFMGVDQDADTVNTGFRNGGQSDFLMLLLIDKEREQIIPLQIDRDTMAEITILGVFGNVAGTRQSQICLSHGFGDGGAQSCELTREAVSTLLMGIDIDFYVSMDLDGISMLNDALGGITVTLEDDFTAYDPTMTIGTTLTLHGDQAEYYVRSRYYIGDGTNATRSVRQRYYLGEMAKILEERERADQNYVGELFDTLEPYLQTDMHRGRIINEAWKARNYERTEIVTLQGTYGEDSQGFVEFYADEEALREMVLNLFYEPI